MAQPVKKVTMVFAAKSDIGLVRTENQDSFGKYPEDNTDLNAPKGQLFIVADGMGGHKGGKEASSIAVKVVSQVYLESSFDEAVALKEAIEKANETIFNKSGNASEFNRMGTTCSVLLIKNERGVIGHVGDSRIYKIENNTIEQLTNDHTKVAEMLAAGILTPEEARNYPSKSVLARALGVDERVRVDIIDDITIKRGQSFVLCSDGLAKVSKGEILSVVANNNPQEACKILVDMANDRGGKDNVTVIIVKIDPDFVTKIHLPKPVTKVRVKRERKAKKWVGLGIILTILLLLLFEYKDSLLSVFFNQGNEPEPKNVTVVTKKNNPPVQQSDPEDELVSKADTYLKKGDYEHAFALYKSVLDDEPMHQAALKGVNEIASAYLSKASNLMDPEKF